MGKSILITGVAGSGKSSISHELQGCGYRAVDIKDVGGLFQVLDKETGQVVKHRDNDNLESVQQGDWVCSKEKMQTLLAHETAEVQTKSGS